MIEIVEEINTHDMKPAIRIDGVVFTLELIQDLKCIMGQRLEDLMYNMYSKVKVAKAPTLRNEYMTLNKEYFTKIFYEWHDKRIISTKKEIDYMKHIRAVS